MRRTRRPLLFALLIPVCLNAAPLTDVVHFDVSGDGTTTAALRLRQVGNGPGGLLSIGHPLNLIEGRTYCASFQLAVDNQANGRSGRYRFFVKVGTHTFDYITEKPLAGVVQRDVVSTVFTAGSETESEIRLEVHHDSGPEQDPTLYIDAVEIVPLVGELLEDRYEQRLFVDGETTIAWDHDLASRGVRPTDDISAAQVELLVWDDQGDSFEAIELSVNGVALPIAEVDGSEAEPVRLTFAIPWIACRDGFDGILHFRLSTIPLGTSPAGDLYFGAATVQLIVGRFESSVLENGEFESGARGWKCDGAPCEPTTVEMTTWGAVKQRYRAR